MMDDIKAEARVLFDRFDSLLRLWKHDLLGYAIFEIEVAYADDRQIVRAVCSECRARYHADDLGDMWRCPNCQVPIEDVVYVGRGYRRE